MRPAAAELKLKIRSEGPQKDMVRLRALKFKENKKFLLQLIVLDRLTKQGAEIYVAECDTAIHNHYFYKGKAPDLISGRGGTAFDAPLAYANDIYNPDAIIYFTDGYGPEPEVNCRKPILWMITSAGIDHENWEFLPGRKVKMNKQLF